MSTATLEKPAKEADTKTDTRPLRSFRLIGSLHWDDDNVLHDARDPKTMIVKSHRDLVAEFGREKFIEIFEPQANVVTEIKYVPMESLSLTDLQKYARENDIDLKGAKDKPGVLKVLQATFNS